MKLLVEFQRTEARLVLQGDDQVIGERRWPLDRDVSQRLLMELDQLLQAHKLERKEITQVEVSTVPIESSIIQSGIVTAKVLGIALEEK